MLRISLRRQVLRKAHTRSVALFCLLTQRVTLLQACSDYSCLALRLALVQTLTTTARLRALWRLGLHRGSCLVAQPPCRAVARRAMRPVQMTM